MKRRNSKIKTLFLALLSMACLSSCTLFDATYEPYYPQGKMTPPTYTISETKVSLSPGEEKQLDAQVDGVTVPFDLVWTSADENVCTVNSRGLVKAVAGGSCVVKAKFKEGVFAQCLITVSGETKEISTNELARFFRNKGQKTEVKIMDVFMYNVYKFNKEELTAWGTHTCELRYTESTNDPTPIHFDVDFQDGEYLYRMLTEFVPGQFEGATSTVVVTYPTSSPVREISSAIMIDGTYLKLNKDNETVSLADGKTFPCGNDTFPEKDASPEAKLMAFSLINYAIDFFKEVRNANGASNLKLF